MEVKAKAASELLEIWANQNDYVAEMVTLVKAEMRKAKSLHTQHPRSHSRRKEEEEEEEAAKALSAKFTFLRHLAFLQPKMLDG